MSTALTKEVSRENQILGDKVLDFLFQTLSIDIQWSIRDKTGFTWWPYRLAQRIWFEPISVNDGSAYIRLHAETSVFRNVPKTFETSQRLDALNRCASLSAYVWDTDASRITSHFCAYVRDETFGWLKTILAAAVGLQIVDVHTEGTEAEARSLEAQLDESTHPKLAKRQVPDAILSALENAFAPVGNHPLPFNANDFKRTVQTVPNPWIMANADDSGFTAELAFDGTIPAVELRGHADKEGVQTTLLQVFSKEKHPRFGSGIILRMSLPLEMNREQAIIKAHELNRAETYEHTLSYFMGAWCSASPLESTYSSGRGKNLTIRMLARLMKRPLDEVSQVVAEAIDQNDLPLANVSFITFLPRIALYSIDVLSPLLWSMAARSRWAKQHFSWQ